MSCSSISGLCLGVCVFFTLAAAGCSDGDTGTPGTADPDGGTATPAPEGDAGRGDAATTSSKNEVDLTITGDVTATLKGMAGTCGGVPGGASFQVRSEELGVSPAFELAVVILGEPDWATPPTVLNVKEGAKPSYAWKKSTGTVVAQRDRSRVDIDAQLDRVAGGGSVTVKGSIRCNR